MAEVDLLDTIKRRYASIGWRKPRQGAASMFVSNLAVRGDEVPSMRAVRVRRVVPATLVDRSRMPSAAARGPAAADRAPLAHSQSLWQPSDASGVIVRVDLFECFSQADADEKAVWLLGEFQSPSIWPTTDLGDFGFAGHADGVLLFVRGNVVCLLRNVGRNPCPLRSAALALDAHALSTPSADRRPVGVAARGVRADDGGEIAGDIAGEIVEVALAETVDSESASVCRKFIAPAGELVARGTSILYRGPRSGLERLAAYELECSQPADAVVKS